MAGDTRSKNDKLPAVDPQQFIWKLINLWDSPIRQFFGFLGFLILFRWVMGGFVPSLLLIISMILHEVGHGFILNYGKIRYKIFFLFPLGAVAAPINEIENLKSDHLPANTLAWLMQAGLLVNVFLLILGRLMIQVDNSMINNLGKDLVYINLLLAVFNILPVWTLDAGQLFHVIYSSLEEVFDAWLMWIFIMLAGGILVLIGVATTWQRSLLQLLKNIGWVTFLAVFIIGMIRKAAKDDVTYPETGVAMSKPQIALQLAIYFGMVLVLFGKPVFP